MKVLLSFLLGVRTGLLLVDFYGCVKILVGTRVATELGANEPPIEEVHRVRIILIVGNLKVLARLLVHVHFKVSHPSVSVVLRKFSCEVFLCTVVAL